jgi:hypothetical protein
MISREEGVVVGDQILLRLVHKYAELAEMCYRVSVSFHDGRGRLARGNPRRSPHPALLKKVDLDAALAEIYARFFGAAEEPAKATATSKSLFQGNEMLSSSHSSGTEPSVS